MFYLPVEDSVKMSSASKRKSLSWRDMDETIFLCGYCDQRMAEPLLLPCHHRCCRRCLEQHLKEQEKIICPKCGCAICVGADGIDSFQTDYLARYLVKCITEIDEIYLSLKKKEKVACCSCTKKKVASRAYFFNCKGYLCDGCRKVHDESPALEDHRPAVIKQSDLTNQDINSHELFSRNSPKCVVHSNKTATKYCKDCNNMLVCNDCLAERHNVHGTNKISVIVGKYKNDLSMSISVVSDRVEDAKQKQERIDSATNYILEKVTKISRQLTTLQQQKLSKIAEDETRVEKHYQELKENSYKSSESDIRNLELMMEKEMEEVRAKYDPLFKERKAKAEEDVRLIEAELEDERKDIRSTRETSDVSYNQKLKELFAVRNEKMAPLQAMKALYNQCISRHENLSATVMSIMATGSDEIALKCIPTLTAAIENLNEEINKQFPSIDSLEEIPSFDVLEISDPYIDENEVSDDSFDDSDEEPVYANCYEIGDESNTSQK